MQRPRCATVIVTACLLSGCATMGVGSHTEHGLAWSHYRTFDWGPADSLPPSDPRFQKDPSFRDQIEGAVERQLAAKGFERSAATATPDLLIHYHAAINERINVDEIDREYRCDIADCRAMVYDAGTLMLDFIDARTNRLAWRGWAEGSLDGVIDDQRWMEETIDKAIDGILTRFPR